MDAHVINITSHLWYSSYDLFIGKSFEYFRSRSSCSTTSGAYCKSIQFDAILARLPTYEIRTNNNGSISNNKPFFSKNISRWNSCWTDWRLINFQTFPSSFIWFVFLAELLLVLRKFGKCNIKWPKNDGVNHNMPGLNSFFLCSIKLIVFYSRLLSCSISWITFCLWTS